VLKFTLSIVGLITARVAAWQWIVEDL
jgi:hypothetical protein